MNLFRLGKGEVPSSPLPAGKTSSQFRSKFAFRFLLSSFKSLGHSHWRSPEGPWPLNFNFRTKKGPSGIYCFLWVFRNYRYQKFRNFYNVKSFGQFEAVFHFFWLQKVNKLLHVRPSEKVRYLTLDFLKNFWMWPYEKRMSKILNVRL